MQSKIVGQGYPPRCRQTSAGLARPAGMMGAPPRLHRYLSSLVFTHAFSWFCLYVFAHLTQTQLRLCVRTMKVLLIPTVAREEKSVCDSKAKAKSPTGIPALRVDRSALGRGTRLRASGAVNAGVLSHQRDARPGRYIPAQAQGGGRGHGCAGRTTPGGGRGNSHER